MGFRNGFKSVLGTVTGKRVESAVTSMTEVHGEILVGMEARLDSTDRKIAEFDAKLRNAGLAEGTLLRLDRAEQGLDHLQREVRRLRTLMIALTILMGAAVAVLGYLAGTAP